MPSSQRSSPVHEFVYLASQSPRRAQLLDQIGVRHRPLLADADEDAEALEAERAGELPLDYVRRVTQVKLAAARQRLQRRGLQEAPILCADTTVALGRRILAKPESAEHAVQMLRQLAGRTHRVMTAVAVASGTKRWLEVNLSRVRMAPMSTREIERYVASGEPMGKAGAYAIQGRIGAYVTHIEGSFTGIMGLPLHEAATLLSKAGVATQN